MARSLRRPIGMKTTTMQTASLRRRLESWAALAFGLALVIGAAAGVAREQRELLRVHSSAGTSLIQHLSAMPQFRGDVENARTHLAMLSQVLRPSGASLDLVAAATPPAGGTELLSVRAISLREGVYELRYAVSRPSLRRAALRSAATYATFGLAFTVTALIGLDLLLRARVAYPLRRLAHQIRFMRSGGGWEPVLPAADAEIAEVNDALRELGPALHEQVQSRIEAERRAAAAQVMSDLRARLRPPKRRALALLGDLQARAALSPKAKHEVRAAIGEIELLSSEIDGEERAVFGGPATGTVRVTRAEAPPEARST